MTMSSQQYASLADHTYGRDHLGNTNINLFELVGKTVRMGDGVEYKVMAHVDKPSGYQGTIYQRTDTHEIVVAHRGTEFGREPLKDGLLADGGMVMGRVNSQARDAIELTREALSFSAKEGQRSLSHVAPSVSVTGHSLGGTLAQITAHHFDLRGETFNAFGAASLNYRIPEQATPKVINHVMAADVVSSASPHYGQVRVYASPGEITQLQAAGYSNNRVLDALTPNHPVAASVNTSHMMHNFMPFNGDYKPDTSILADPSARTRAADNARLISGYRSDIESLRSVASLGGDALDVLGGGVLHMPIRAVEKVRDHMQAPLPAGEPARLETEQKQPRGASLAPETRAPDMRHTDHPAHGKYQQAYAGMSDIDRTMGRTPDGVTERVAAALTAEGAGLREISRVALNRDGSRVAALDESSGLAEARQRVDVEIASAIQQPVEASTARWQAHSQQLAQTQAQQQRAQEQVAPTQTGPALA